MKDVLTAVLFVLVGLAAIAGFSEVGYRIYQRYAPLNEQVRRTTYENSRAFQEGTIRDLENMQMEYAKGNDAQKEAIRSVALHRLADVPDELLTPNLRQFRHSLESIQ